MKYKKTSILILSAMCVSSLWAAGLDDLTRVKDWNQLGHGIWCAEIGEMGNDLRYSDLAAAPPKIDQINQLSDHAMPAQIKDVSYHIAADGKILVRIPTAKDEKIFGFGLQFDNTQKSGQIVELKVDHFNKGGGATHAPVPFYISSKGYGVFFNTSKYIKIYNQVGSRKDSPNNPPEVDRNPPEDEPQAGPWLAVPPGDAVEAFIHGKGIEIVAFAGKDIQDVVARYNLYSGGGAMPPFWGLGFWHRVPSKYSAQETEKEIEEFRKHNIPLDVVGLEPGWQTKSYPCTFEWQKKRFPDPAAFSSKLLDDGLKLNLWVNPYISKHSSIYEKMYPLSGSHMVWLGIVPDYTLPEARTLLINQHKKEHFDIGISGYKIDEVDGYDFWLWPDHATFPSGTSAETMRQTYGMQLQHMLHKELFHKNNQRTYSLIRASNGAASNYPFVIYSDSYGHDEYITGLSSASLCGILWCPEIRSAKNSREWINRMHTVCLSPMAMLNAWASGAKPWNYPEATDAVRRTIQLRMKLLPYFYTAFADYNRKGIPPLRSMLMETGGEKDQVIEQERKLDGETDPYADGFHQKITEDNSLFMFGPSILVAPFYNSDIERKVRLPKGNWYDFYTGEFAGNDTAITVTAAQTKDLPPLYVKEGAVIPMLRQPANRTRDVYGAEIEVRHYGQTAGSCELYEDDGKSYDFEKGEYRIRRFDVLQQADGSFKMKETIVSSNSNPLFGKAVFKSMTE